MGDDIELGKLTDREILILVAMGQKQDRKRIDNHGERIRILERIVYPAIAVAGVVGGWFKIRAHVE